MYSSHIYIYRGRPYTPGRTRSQSLGVLLKAWTTEDEQYGTYGQRRFNRSLRRRLVSS